MVASCTRILAALTALSLLNGCAQMQSLTGESSCNASMTQAEQQLCQDNSTFNQTMFGGAALGAASGALLGGIGCLAAGNNNPLACAGVGAAAGLFVGGVSGYLVAKQQEANTQQRRAIDAITGDLVKQNRLLQTDVTSAREVVAQSRQKLATLDYQTRTGQITADQAQAERARISANSKNLNELIHHLQEQQTKFEQAGQQSHQSSSHFDAQLATMRTQIASLERQRDALNAALSTSSVSSRTS